MFKRFNKLFVIADLKPLINGISSEDTKTKREKTRPNETTVGIELSSFFVNIRAFGFWWSEDFPMLREGSKHKRKPAPDVYLHVVW